MVGKGGNEGKGGIGGRKEGEKERGTSAKFLPNWGGTTTTTTTTTRTTTRTTGARGLKSELPSSSSTDLFFVTDCVAP